MTNKEIAQQFTLISKFMDIHREDDEKAKTFSSTAFSIDRYPTPINELPIERVAKIRGIGTAMSQLIDEYLTTNQLKILTAYISNTPPGIIEIMSIKGIGPKKISTIWHELEIETPGELLYACNENRLVQYKGFGEKTQQTIIEAVEYYLANQGRFLYASIEPIYYQVLDGLGILFGNENIRTTGSFARQCEIIDELEFVIIASNEMVFEALSSLRNWELIEDDGETFAFKFHDLIHIIIHACNEDDACSKLFFTLGSANFIEAFEGQFQNIDYGQSLSELDEEIFHQAQIPFIPPPLRDSSKSIKLALENQLPNSISTTDVKGVIHAHSTWSDGKNTIEEMALACIKKGYEYLVMSDHSVTSFYAKGLSIERIYQQHEEIDKLNEKLKPFKIFKSIECDILSDGRLDYSDDVLATFDVVIISIHQNLNMTVEKAMSRLLPAIENPYSRILAHSTGRLLLSRKGYEVDYKTLFEACKKNNVVIELNANPRRLDLDWRFINQAIESGLTISINPDAHSIQGIDDIKYGVLIAQKSIMESKHNLSSMSLIEFEAFLQAKKI
jgi:DNA polymerase (family X)